MDQNLPNFDPHPLKWTKMSIYILSTHCHVTNLGLSNDPHPPHLFHVFFECPLIQSLKGCNHKIHEGRSAT